MSDDGLTRTPDQELRHLLEGLLNDPRFIDRIPIDDLGEAVELLGGVGQGNTIDENQAILDSILNGDTLAPGDTFDSEGPNLASEGDPGPTFEELFQETLAEAVGPDPTATFQNIFSDIFTGDVFTPFEQFVMSNQEVLQRQFTTEARALAEQGKPIPTFEDFLEGQKDDLETKFQFTDPGASLALNDFIKGTGKFISTPFNQFVLRNFNRLFDDFIQIQDEAERSDAAEAEANERFGLREFGVKDPQTTEDFGQFLEGQEEDLRTEFGFTFEGAQQSFRDLQRVREGAGIAESPFERFLEGNFPSLFSEFERSDPNIVGSFADFVGQNEDRFRTEFGLRSPRTRSIDRAIPTGKSPTRVQV